MTTFDAVATLMVCSAVYGGVTAAEKLATWLLWRHLRKLARQRLAHPEIEQ